MPGARISVAGTRRMHFEVLAEKKRGGGGRDTNYRYVELHT